MHKRPKSITVIAWILIVSCGLWPITYGLKVVHILEMRARGAAVQISFRDLFPGCVAFGIALASGTGMLKGRNWARRLYTAWGIISIIVDLLFFPSPILLILKVIVYLVYLSYLYSLDADNYFGDNPVKPSLSDTDTGQRSGAEETGLR